MKTFDITLHGYIRGWDNYERHYKKEANKWKVNRILDDLVKWVNAPSIDAMDAFVEVYQLFGLLDQEPREMIGRTLDFTSGVDLVIDEFGLVTEIPPGSGPDMSYIYKWPALWKAQIAEARPYTSANANARYLHRPGDNDA